MTRSSYSIHSWIIIFFSSSNVKQRQHLWFSLPVVRRDDLILAANETMPSSSTPLAAGSCHSVARREKWRAPDWSRGRGVLALPQYSCISAPLIKTLRHAESSAGGGLRGVQGGSLPLPLPLPHSLKAAAAAAAAACRPARICALLH